MKSRLLTIVLVGCVGVLTAAILIGGRRGVSDVFGLSGADAGPTHSRMTQDAALSVARLSVEDQLNRVAASASGPESARKAAGQAVAMIGGRAITANDLDLVEAKFADAEPGQAVTIKSDTVGADLEGRVEDGSLWLFVFRRTALPQPANWNASEPWPDDVALEAEVVVSDASGKALQTSVGTVSLSQREAASR